MIEPFQIILLTHEREVSRQSNTGSIALHCYPEYCQRVIWSRVNPEPKLVDWLNRGQAALLFPDEIAFETPFEQTEMREEKDNKTNDINTLDVPNVLVILDATWQEARKMCRRSDYLKQAQKYALPQQIIASQLSQFTLRRNQIEGGFCTIECIQFLFRLKGMQTQADKLAQAFKDFNQNGDKITRHVTYRTVKENNTCSVARK
ncbi:tRNA-uridine aminocarboxypropyltransferase [uncultured Shewanella sp.]|uniref:tRNA-uridine aminocarboxypropyltransferase n=1 Tax=uncultured Shewanella sp. TaxID=173975 RepID=UPI00261CCDFB|nr:tRNA-uridine aminocarboxypropyltransferase [uncultured Shewanella sp.]